KVITNSNTEEQRRKNDEAEDRSDCGCPPGWARRYYLDLPQRVSALRVRSHSRRVRRATRRAERCARASGRGPPGQVRRNCPQITVGSPPEVTSRVLMSQVQGGRR